MTALRPASPLRQRRFALLWTAALVSMTGDWLLRVAVPIYVFQLTDSPAATATVVAADVTARLTTGPLAGVYVDRWDRRRVMVVANLAQAAVLLPLLAVTTADQLPLLYAVVFAQAMLAEFVRPAQHALLPQLVAAEQLTAANSLNGLNNNLARLAGPALGGLATATLGLGGVALIDAGSFLTAAALVALISGGYRPTDQVPEPGRSAVARVRHELAAGVHVIVRSRLLRLLFAAFTLTAVGEGIMGSLFPLFVGRELGGGATHFGWLMSGQAAGGILGALLLSRYAAELPPTRLVSVGLIAFGLTDLVIFNYPRAFAAFPPVLVLFAVAGLMSVPMFTGLVTLLQTEVADGLRGRVFAAFMFAQAAAALLGAGLAGSLTDRFGVLNVLTAQGAGYALAGLLFATVVRRVPPPVRRAQPS